MKKPKTSTYSVAMSKDTGAIVFLRTNGRQVTVIGSMTREDSMQFVRGILDWSKEVITDEAPRIALN
jgi:hypothetical protein